VITEEEIVKQYKPLVIKTALRFSHHGVPLDDLIQEGMLEVAKANRAWKSTGGANRLTWFSRPVWWAMWRLVNRARREGTTGKGKPRKGLAAKLYHDSMDEELHGFESDNEGDATLHDILGSFEEPPDFWLLDRLRVALNRLPKREQEILRLRFVCGKTLGEIGTRFQLSRERIRQLEAEALMKLRQRLPKEEAA